MAKRGSVYLAINRFDVTGIVDAELSIQSEEPRELRLVLCGGDSCQKQNFRGY